MKDFKIKPETPDEIALCKDCDLTFAKTDYDVIVLDPRIIDSTQALFDDADPQRTRFRPKR